MFKSKLRPVATPQWEHQKLAGTLALLWGNADFDQPPVPRTSFVAGVGLHDRAYGPIDNLPIGELPEAEWLALTRAGFDAAWDDPVADLIAKAHLRRLTGYGGAPERQALAAAMAQEIERLAAQHGLDLATLDRLDRITNLCDQIAFDFCFEAPAAGAVAVFPHSGGAQVSLGYRIADGVIAVDPWPFGVDEHAGYLVGYQLEGYPDRLEPALLPYRLVRGGAA